MFFRAGVLGQMEDLRDERLGKIVTWMQSWVRGYLSRKEFKRLQEQRLALQVCQRNLRKYLKLRTWPWYKLWQKVRPLLNVTRIEDEIAVSIWTILRYILLIYKKKFTTIILWFQKCWNKFGRNSPKWSIYNVILVFIFGGLKIVKFFGCID